MSYKHDGLCLLQGTHKTDVCSNCVEVIVTIPTPNPVGGFSKAERIHNLLDLRCILKLALPKQLKAFDRWFFPKGKLADSLDNLDIAEVELALGVTRRTLRKWLNIPSTHSLDSFREALFHFINCRVKERPLEKRLISGPKYEYLYKSIGYTYFIAPEGVGVALSPIIEKSASFEPIKQGVKEGQNVKAGDFLNSENRPSGKFIRFFYSPRGIEAHNMGGYRYGYLQKETEDSISISCWSPEEGWETNIFVKKWIKIEIMGT